MHFKLDSLNAKALGQQKVDLNSRDFRRTGTAVTALEKTQELRKYLLKK